MFYLPFSSQTTPSRPTKVPTSGSMARRSWLRPVGLLALVVVAISSLGCPASWDRKQKSSLSAIWIANESQPLESSEVARLKDSGVEEAFVPAARLDPDEDDPLVRLEVPAIGGTLPATLGIRGNWSIADREEAEALALRVAESARQLRFDVESLGLLVVGLHFDLLSVSDFETYGAFLGAVNSHLDDEIFLSATVERDWIGKEGLAEVADRVDYLVAFVYGQRVSEAESSDAWDFGILERRLQDLEKLGTPYQIGVVTLGTASHKGSGGTVRSTRQSLQEILWDRNLKLKPGFSLEGVNRRVYAVIAENDTRLGDWEIEQGDQIRVVRAATSDIEELARLVDLWDLPNHLGQLYYRLPSEEEYLSLHVESLLEALDPEPASPDLDFTVSLQRRTGKGWLVRFGLVNQNGEFTELALLDNNYLQVTVDGGEFASNVNTGDFYRFDLLRWNNGELEKTFRDPDVLRVHVPILEGEQTVGTGNVEVIVRGKLRFVLEARFLLPDGRTLELGPRAWSEGQFEDQAERTASEGS